MSQRENRETQVIDYEVALSNAELLAYGAEMAELDDQEDRLVSEQKASAASFKARVNDLESARKRLAAAVRAKKETRTGECVVEYDYDAGEVKFALLETEQIVYRRPMANEERQLKLFGQRS